MPRILGNYNLTISMEKDSYLHKALLRDAKKSGTKQYGVLAAKNLTTFYEWEEQGLVALLATLTKGGRIVVKGNDGEDIVTDVQPIISEQLGIDEILKGVEGADDVFPE